MPKEVENKLKAQAAKHKDWSKEKKDAYVWGTMYKHGLLKNKPKDKK